MHETLGLDLAQTLERCGDDARSDRKAAASSGRLSGAIRREVSTMAMRGTWRRSSGEEEPGTGLEPVDVLDEEREGRPSGASAAKRSARIRARLGRPRPRPGARRRNAVSLRLETEEIGQEWQASGQVCTAREAAVL